MSNDAAEVEGMVCGGQMKVLTDSKDICHRIISAALTILSALLRKI